MKTSWNKCIEFSNVAQSYLIRTEQRESKLSYAIKRTMARIQKQQEAVTEALSDIEIEYCVTEKDIIVRDAQGRLQYTKDGLRERNKATRKYLSENNIEIEPYFATELPAGLAEMEIEAFSGFVINAEDAERLLQDDRPTEIVAAPNGHQAHVTA